jgi:hypothetical protein
MTAATTAQPIKIDEHMAIKEFNMHEITESNLAAMKEQILAIPELPETKEQYTSVRDMNIQAKRLLPKIEERRKEIKAPHLDKCRIIDGAAKKAKSMIVPLIELSDSRRSAWEDKIAKEKAEKEQIEKERVEKLNNLIDCLLFDCRCGLTYNRESTLIEKDLARLENIKISSVDYQERIEEAEHILAKGIADTKLALENRKKFEAQMVETARIKAEQEAESKHLAEEKAKLEAERKANDEAARKQAESEAEKLRLEREAIEKEKAMLEAERHAYIEKRYLADWDEAIKINRITIPDSAKDEHEQYKTDLRNEENLLRAEAKARWESTEKARIEAAERKAILQIDKKIIIEIANEMGKWISVFPAQKFKTPECHKLFYVLIENIKSNIKAFEESGEALI